MSRYLLAILLVLGGCAVLPDRTTDWEGYNGYGEGMPTVSASYVLQGRSGASEIAVADIGPVLTEFLSPGGDKLILLPNRLDRSRLDFSIASLAAIDEWLRDIHTINKLQADTGRAGEALISDGRGDNSVMFAGLYLGEVVRATSRLDWRWERFDRFIAANPYFTEHYGYDAGLDSFVLVGPQGVATPINTALKRVLFGREESLQFIAEFLSGPIDLNQATSGYDFYGLDQVG